MNKSIIKISIMAFYLNSFLFMMSTNSLFFIWICFEFNMMMFIPLLNKLTYNLINNILKYFIIQSISSSILLYFFLMKLINMNSNFIHLLIFMALWVKMGLFPFSSWFFQITENMQWNMWFLFNSLQKLLPLWMLSFINTNNNLLNIMIIFNSMYSALEIWNQNSIRWLINSSSLNHFSWMMISLTSTLNNMWFNYYLGYLVISFMMYKILIYLNWNTMINMINNSQIILKIKFNVLLINFMAMPPTLGFIPKLLIIMNNKSIMMNLIMIMNSVIIMYMYIMYIMPQIMLNLKNKILMTKKLNYNIFILLLTGPMYLIMLF